MVALTNSWLFARQLHLCHETLRDAVVKLLGFRAYQVDTGGTKREKGTGVFQGNDSRSLSIAYLPTRLRGRPTRRDLHPFRDTDPASGRDDLEKH
jgi:hypothetical protein